MFVQPLTWSFLYSLRFLVISFLISETTGAFDYSTRYQQSIVDYYEAHGTIKWIWDPDAFCASQILKITPAHAGNFIRSYIRELPITMEKVDCMKIQMEAVHCVYDFFDRETGSYKQRTKLYVNDHGGFKSEIFSIFKARYPRSMCNDSEAWMLFYNRIYPWVRKPISREIIPTPRPEELAQIVNIEKLLAECYTANGDLKFIRNRNTVCRMEKSAEFEIVEELITKRRVILEWASCAKIQIEVLKCTYRFVPPVEGRAVKAKKSRSYANGPNGEIFRVGKPMIAGNCDDIVSWIIYYEILEDERTTSRSSDSAGDSAMMDVEEKEERFSFRRRKWPTFEVDGQLLEPRTYVN